MNERQRDIIAVSVGERMKLEMRCLRMLPLEPTRNRPTSTWRDALKSGVRKTAQQFNKAKRRIWDDVCMVLASLAQALVLSQEKPSKKSIVYSSDRRNSISELCSCGASFGMTSEHMSPTSMMHEIDEWRGRHQHTSQSPQTGSGAANVLRPEFGTLAGQSTYAPQLGFTSNIDETNPKLDLARASEWQLKYAGKPCTVCGEILQVARSLTTLESYPLHVDCRKCWLCQKKKPHAMKWAQYGTEARLEHPHCRRDVDNNLEINNPE